MSTNSQDRPKSIRANAVILGFTGSIGSGCTFLSKALADKEHFKYYCLSEPIHEEARGRGVEETIENLQTIGNEIRERNGYHHWAEYAIRKLDEEGATDKIIIDSIKNLDEVRYLSQFQKFYLISVYADSDLRYERLKEKGLYKLREEFDRDDERDALEDLPYGQQVKKCNDLADISFNNLNKIPKRSKTRKEDYISDFYNDHIRVIVDGPSNETKPTAMETYMTMAYCESRRSGCLQRKVGAVITTGDGQVISTGYNDVPKEEIPCIDQSYAKCYRIELKESFAQSIIHCPSCGEKVNFKAKCPNIKCNKEFDKYVIFCPDCEQEFKPIYSCKNCREDISKYIPGEKTSPGKLLDMCRALHAEEMAIINLIKSGGGLLGDATLYTTTYPCKLCANKIVEAGIKKVIFDEPYTMKDAEKLFKNKRIEVKKFEGVKSKAYFKLFGFI